MAYYKRTPNYQFPYISDSERMNGADEETAALIIDNQLRAALLGAGGTRVFAEGEYTAEITDAPTGRVTVTLASTAPGLPSVQGIADEGLIEIYQAISWTDIPANTFTYLYLQSISGTYLDPTFVTIIASDTPITDTAYLFLATIDTTNTDSDPPTQPVLNTSPVGKPTAANLFTLLNNNNSPFGPSLTQTILTVIERLSVILDADQTALFQQLNVNATLPVLTIDNESNKPDLLSSNHALTLADVNIPNGFALSDSSNHSYNGIAASILGALNDVLAKILAHIANNHDPHGTPLYQTALVLSSFLQVSQLQIDPPLSLPPAPPGPPIPPGQIYYSDILSSGELRISDLRGGLAWSDNSNPYYLGTAVSLIGALNQLLDLIQTLTDQVNGFLGDTLPATSPLLFRLNPEELGLNLNFKITISNYEDFSTVLLTRDTKTSVTGWWYEYQPPAPPLPPAAPLTPNTLPGAIMVLDPPGLPVWVAFPEGGLPASLQRDASGNSVKIKYEPQSGDHIYAHVKYSLSFQENNGEYGDAALSSRVLS